MKIRPVILSGGSGTRLWPVSRAKAPKQFVPLIGEENLFAVTVRSVLDKSVFMPPMIVGNAEHKFLIGDAFDACGVKDATVILEPVGKNTAAAAIAAALCEKDGDVLHLLRPSDHVIADQSAWHNALAKAVPAAASGFITLFGIKPDYAETGYGYIQAGDATPYGIVRKIAAFKEKPDEAGATALILSGALWNSGIFLYKPSALLDEARRLAPALVQQIADALAAAKTDALGLTLDARAYGAIKSDSIDRVIMEHTALGAVMPCSMGWSDVGSWQAMWQASAKDATGNAFIGPVVAVDSKGCYVRSDGPTVAVLGLQDVAVVATKDVVMVAPRARTQEVKNLLAEVEKTSPSLAQEHNKARRPWGAYESIARGDNFQVKHITVLPGRALSLQMHHHRAEHWIVVAGTALVDCDDTRKLVFPNESVYIPKGSKHRLTNPGKVELHLIEVQSGDYLGEDDIIRFADDFGRAK